MESDVIGLVGLIDVIDVIGLVDWPNDSCPLLSTHCGAPRVIVVLHDAVAALEIPPMQRHSNCFYISISSSAKNIFSAGFLRIQKQNCLLVTIVAKKVGT